ncbi:hypothetical protein D046_0913, partial [Vibrio parahaemolyticus V-223/04]
HVCAAASCT